MRIAICEDENSQINLTLENLERWKKERNKVIEVFTYENAEEFLFEWSEGKSPFDLIFLDIKMKKMNGIELAKVIRKNNDNMLIIFVTGFLDYVVKGYELQAFHYLIKPVKTLDYFSCLDRASELIMQRRNETFVFFAHGIFKRLRYDDIIYFEIRSHYIEINSTKGKFLFKYKMDELELELQEERFFRCHRSYIVNLYYVNSIKKSEAILDDGTVIPVSNKRLNDMNNAFMKYYFKRIKL